MMHKFVLVVRSSKTFYVSQTNYKPLSLVFRIFDLNQDQGILSESDVERSVAKRGLLGRLQCRRAIELLGLRSSRVFGLTHCGPSRQYISVIVIDSLKRYLGIFRDA